MRAQVADDFLGDLRQIGDRIREERAPTGLRRQLVNQPHGFFPRALANQTGVLVELVDEADDEDLHVFLAQTSEELFLFVEAVAILTVGDHD